MYRLLSEILDPLVWLFVVVSCVIAVWLWRRRRTVNGRKLALALALLLIVWAISTPLAAHLSLLSLEGKYSPIRKRPSGASVIVVLSGSLRRKGAVGKETELERDTLYRCLEAARLYRQGPPVKLIVCGGSSGAHLNDANLASAMRDFLLTLGVAAVDIIEEGRSRSTYENAVECAKKLEQIEAAKCILVSDATHLPRAEACFRAQGVETIPAGAYFRATGMAVTPRSFLPSATAFEHHRVVLHEWCGLCWYWMLGRI